MYSGGIYYIIGAGYEDCERGIGTMNFCMKCGTKLKPGDRFCGACGSKVPDAPQAASAVSQPVQEQAAAPQQPAPGKTVAVPQPVSQQTEWEQPFSVPGQLTQDEWEDEFEMVPPVQHSPYARPVPPQRYEQNQGGYFGQRPQQQSGYNGNYGRPQPRPDGYGNHNRSQYNGNGYNRPQRYGGRPAGNRKVQNQGLLKLLSLVFALGLLALAIGLGSSIYQDRSYRETLKDFDGTNQEKELAERSMTSIIREDPTEFLNLSREMLHISGTYQFDGTLNNIQKDVILNRMKQFNETVEKRAGYRWYFIKVGTMSDPFIIGGGSALGVALVLWLILGGTKAGLSRTTILPMLVMILIWAACIMLLAFVISPVSLTDTVEGMVFQDPLL